MGIYFSSKIYYNDNKFKNQNNPTFSILNEENDFDLQKAVNFINSSPNFKNIFIIMSGQQSFQNLANEDFDILFGLRLTGADRLSEKWNNGFLWNGEYKIYKSTPDDTGRNNKTSVASALYDKFNSNSLIIDIVNCKFDWNRFYVNNQKTVENIYEQLNEELLSKIINMNNINILIFGFSRGAIMGFYLVDRLIINGLKNNIKAFVTVDPVINPLKKKELTDLEVKWYRRDDGNWRPSEKRPPLSGTYLPSFDFFPVLKLNHDIPCYNVFQRRSIIYSDKFIKMPIGSAVSKAVSLNNIKFSLNNKIEEIIKTQDDSFDRLLSQYDEIIKNHTPDMIDKQWEKMVKIAEILGV